MKIGIDKLAFATTPYYLAMEDLAQGRNVDPNKYLIGIGQSKQAVVPPTQDVVTLAAAAADKLLDPVERDQVSTVIVATESGIDNSKAAAVYVKHLLKLSDFTRAVEVKEACYSATAALQFARGLVALNPQEKILVIASDIARYGLETGGEVTQGAGAVAMLITANPRVLAIEPTSVAYTKDVMDFWRPLYVLDQRLHRLFQAVLDPLPAAGRLRARGLRRVGLPLAVHQDGQEGPGDGIRRPGRPSGDPLAG